MSDSLRPHGLSMLGLPVLHCLPQFVQTHIHWVGDAIQPSHPPSPPSPPAFSRSQHQGLFQWVSSSQWWPKYWNFSFSISPSREYSGLISFMINWFNLFTFQQTLESILQHHNLKVLILQWSAFLMAQLLHPYMSAGKTITLTIWTFVGKVMSLFLIYWLGLL